LSVLFGHAYILSNGINHGEDFVSSFLVSHFGKSLPSIAVDIFFVISGYLIVASYTKHNNSYNYFKARILRIYPALVVAVLFCIFAGAFSTSLSVSQYFMNPEVKEFLFTNVFALNGIKFNLPGVFLNNPYPISVNGSLWTLTIELRLYVLVLILGILSLLKKNHFNILFYLSLTTLFFFYESSILANNLRNIELILLFFTGSFLYLNKNSIESYFKIWIAITILCGVNFLFSWNVFLLKSLWLAFSVILLATHKRLTNHKLIFNNDYSYGIYIYAFPVQQILAHFFIGIDFLMMLLSSLFLTTSLALLSWNLIEKPFLRFKK
jgi:peptidoglycan/LPS O-acetylase OafA/YrhL